RCAEIAANLASWVASCASDRLSRNFRNQWSRRAAYTGSNFEGPEPPAVVPNQGHRRRRLIRSYGPRVRPPNQAGDRKRCYRHRERSDEEFPGEAERLPLFFVLFPVAGVADAAPEPGCSVQTV